MYPLERKIWRLLTVPARWLLTSKIWSHDDLIVTQEGDTRVYKTASEGPVKFRYGLLFAAILLALLTCLFWAIGVWAVVLLWVLAAPFALATLGTNYGNYLEAKNCRILVSDAGLTVVGSRRRQRFIPAESLVSLVQKDFAYRPWRPQEYTGNSRLLCGVHGGSGRLEWVQLAHFEGPCPPVLAALRDDLIARHGFQEVPPELRTRAQVFLDHLSHMKVRTWA